MKFAVLVFLFFVFNFANADDTSESNPLAMITLCKHEQIITGYWSFSRFFTRADGCLVQVRPANNPTQLYREYIFDQTGRMTIFNSTPGDDKTSTSMRTYFLFPQTQLPQMRLENKEVIVTLASGEEAVFAADEPFMKDFRSKDITYSEEKTIDLRPGGGFEILSSSKIYLDAGWKIGDRAYKNPNDQSVFVSPDQSRCPVLNDYIFEYVDVLTKEPHYQPLMRWVNLQDIEKIIQIVCGSDTPKT